MSKITQTVTIQTMVRVFKNKEFYPDVFMHLYANLQLKIQNKNTLKFNI